MDKNVNVTGVYNATIFSNNNSLPPMTFNHADILSLVFLTVIILVGVVGNIFVIVIFGIQKRRSRSRFEFFLLILGIVDLISLLLVPISFFYLTITKYRIWHFGRIGCKIIPSAMNISITVSQGVLVLLSYERYQSILHPFDRGLTNRYIATWLFAIVILAMILVAPYTSTFSIIYDPVQKTASCAPEGNKLHMLIVSSNLALLRDLVALLILALFGYRMNRALTRKVAIATWDRSLMSAKGRKILKIVILIFTMLTLPLDIFQVGFYATSLLGYNINNDVFGTIIHFNTFLNMLQMSNSVVNVFIYSQLHSNFTYAMCCTDPTMAKVRNSTGGSERSTEFDELFKKQRKNGEKKGVSDRKFSFDSMLKEYLKKRRSGVHTVIIYPFGVHINERTRKKSADYIELHQDFL